jgi:hypothetical protein
MPFSASAAYTQQACCKGGCLPSARPPHSLSKKGCPERVVLCSLNSVGAVIPINDWLAFGRDGCVQWRFSGCSNSRRSNSIV